MDDLLMRDIEQLDEAAKVLAVEDVQKDQANKKVSELSNKVDEISHKNDKVLSDFDELIDDWEEIDLTGLETTEELLNSIEELQNFDLSTSTSKMDEPDLLEVVGDGTDFSGLYTSSVEYSKRKGISLDNPYYAGMSNVEINQLKKQLSEKYELSHLDKYDYIFSTSVGIIMGLVDVLLVGSITDGNNPETKNSQGDLGKAVDKSIDKMVIKFAEFEVEGKKTFNDSKSAIRWLEKKHLVSYDAAHNGAILDGEVSGMTANNHHLRSLAHEPSLLGLIVGVVDQLSGKATFIDGSGAIVRHVTKNAENADVMNAEGISKVFKAIFNWLGHIASDAAGSSTSKGRGAGLPAPFYSALSKLHVGSFNINGKDKDAAQVSEWLYNQGLDFRALTAQSLPVLFDELLVRSYWMLKQHYYFGKSWKESLPSAHNKDLQKILLMSLAVFEVEDIGDAVIKRGVGAKTLLNLNFINLLDLGFRSFQVVRSSIKHQAKVQRLDDDLSEEWNRIYTTI